MERMWICKDWRARSENSGGRWEESKRRLTKQEKCDESRCTGDESRRRKEEGTSIKKRLM